MKTVSQLNKEVEELCFRLKAISNELSEIDKAEKEVSTTVDLGRVSTAAKSKLLETYPLTFYTDEIKEYHLKLLFSMLFFHSGRQFDEMVFLYRAAYSAGYGGDLKALHAAALNISDSEFSNIVSALQGAKNENGKLCEFTAVELLLMTRLYTDNKEQALKYLSRIFALFAFDDAQLKFVVSLSEVIGVQRTDRFESSYEYLPAQFYCYVSLCPKVMELIEQSRSAVYLHQPYYGGIHSDFNVKVKYVGCYCTLYKFYIAFAGVIEYGRKDERPYLIVEKIDSFKKQSVFSVGKISEINGQIGNIGLYHSLLDFAALAEQWRAIQPKTDPKYSTWEEYNIKKNGTSEDWLEKLYYCKLDDYEMKNVLTYCIGTRAIKDAKSKFNAYIVEEKKRLTDA